MANFNHRQLFQVLLFLTILCFSKLTSAQDYNTRFQKAWELSDAGKFSEALPLFNQLLAEAPDYTAVHVQLSWIYLCQKNYPKAKEYCFNAYDLWQTDISAVLMKSYILFAENKKEEALFYLDMGIWLDFAGENKQALITDFTNIKKYGVNPAAMDVALAYVKTEFDKRDKTFIEICNLMNSANAYLNKKDSRNAVITFDKALALYNKAPKRFQFLKANTASIIGNAFNRSGSAEAFKYATISLAVADDYPSLVSPSTKLSSAYLVANHYLNVKDYEKSLAVFNNYKSELQNAANYGNYKPNFQYIYLTTQNQAGANNDLQRKSMINYATQLRSTENTLDKYYYWAKAENFLGLVYANSVIPSDRDKSAKYLQSAIALAEKYNYPSLVEEFSPNLAIKYWQSGNKEKAKEIWLADANKALNAGDLAKAENSFNNAGSVFYIEKNFIEAAKYFQKSVDLNEKIRVGLNPEQKILYMQDKAGAYQFLVSSYAQSGNGAMVFATQNKEKARVLSETINQKEQTNHVSLAGFQTLLKADEAALFYSQVEAGTFVINVVTKEGVWPMYVEDFTRWANLKKAYLDRMHAASNKKTGYKPVGKGYEQDGVTYSVSDALKITRPDMEELMELTRSCLQDVNVQIPAQIRDNLLSAYYQSLIAPVLNKIASKKKLIIFPDGVLNFLPFEALIASDRSFLIQKFDVRYCQSADVFKMVNNRVYHQTRKDFLGMGGAVYQDMLEKAEPLSSPSQLIKLQVQAKENADNDKPQRLIYAAIFGSGKMNYLAGTLQEIKNLSTIFPDRDVFYGTDMTENRIKSMSASGQLKNYKILHLATHGFAVEQVPELSGVAMSIFSQQQGNEDGYLNAPEISKLNLNADLAVLSACETGLGKIYGGEGVSGLTGSLLVAGANQALVTLWAVSDAGTMYYMTGLYELVTKNGKNYDEASAIMKRKFLKGDFGSQFTHFNFWAPYISYGK